MDLLIEKKPHSKWTSLFKSCLGLYKKLPINVINQRISDTTRELNRIKKNKTLPIKS